MIKAIIIDDETGAQNTLTGMLKQFCPNIKVVGRATNVTDALQLAEQHSPELIFLDIQLSPTESGFDFIKRSGSDNFGLIFITAYPQFAIKAINAAQPWAYLVKPFSVDDLMEAVWVATKKITQNVKQAESESGNDRLLINDTRKGHFLLHTSDVLCFSSGHSIVEITYLVNNQVAKIHTYQTLKELMEKLSPTVFCRAHHGFIVNLEHVMRFEKTGRGGVAYLNKGIEVPVSVKKTDHFSRLLKGLVGK